MLRRRRIGARAAVPPPTNARPDCVSAVIAGGRHPSRLLPTTMNVCAWLKFTSSKVSHNRVCHQPASCPWVRPLGHGRWASDQALPCCATDAQSAQRGADHLRASRPARLPWARLRSSREMPATVPPCCNRAVPLCHCCRESAGSRAVPTSVARAARWAASFVHPQPRLAKRGRQLFAPKARPRVHRKHRAKCCPWRAMLARVRQTPRHERETLRPDRRSVRGSNREALQQATAQTRSF